MRRAKKTRSLADLDAGFPQPRTQACSRYPSDQRRLSEHSFVCFPRPVTLAFISFFVFPILSDQLQEKPSYMYRETYLSALSALQNTNVLWIFVYKLKTQPRTQACSRYPSDLGELTGDVTSEIAEDDWERGWVFLSLKTHRNACYAG